MIEMRCLRELRVDDSNFRELGVVDRGAHGSGDVGNRWAMEKAGVAGAAKSSNPKARGFPLHRNAHVASHRPVRNRRDICMGRRWQFYRRLRPLEARIPSIHAVSISAPSPLERRYVSHRISPFFSRPDSPLLPAAYNVAQASARRTRSPFPPSPAHAAAFTTSNSKAERMPLEDVKRCESRNEPKVESGIIFFFSALQKERKKKCASGR